MKASPLFSSPLLDVIEVSCDARCGGPGDDERSDVPSLAIPLRGCYQVERGRGGVLADTNMAIFFDAGPAYRVAHPVDGGDVSFVLTYAAGPVADAFGNARRRDSERRPFRATHASLAPRVQLQARLLRAGLCPGHHDRMEIEDRALALLAEIGGWRSAPSTGSLETIERAKANLNEHFRTSISLAEVACAGGENDLARVAVDSGFAHHSHFARHFRSAFDSTPSAFRKGLGNAFTIGER